MPNLTIHLQDKEYSFIRTYAARHRTSASALAADFIHSLAIVSRKSRKRLHPREITDAHCQLLNKSDGCVNDDMRTIWDLVNALKEATKREQVFQNQEIVDDPTTVEMQ